MPARKKVDYERIEPGWRAGVLSPAQLAAEYTEATGVSVSHAAIIKHFKKLGVPRDRKTIDWEAIERDYRAGLKTLRQIADEHSITHAAVNKRAKIQGWSRDLQLKAPGKVVLRKNDEKETSGFLYVIYIDSGAERIYKIGMAKHFGSRFDSHQCSSPFDICVSICYFVPNMRAEEMALHSIFQDKRVRGEWFRLDCSDLDAISKRARLA